MKINPKKYCNYDSAMVLLLYNKFCERGRSKSQTKEIEPRQIQLVYRKGSKFDFGKGRNYVTNIINYYPNRLPKGSFKKVGDKTYIITEEGIEALRSQTENKNKKKE